MFRNFWILRDIPVLPLCQLSKHQVSQIHNSCAASGPPADAFATARENNVKMMQQMRFTWLSTTVLVCSIISITAPASYAQRGKRTFRRAQFEQAIPSVDVPSPANEGSLMPSINDVIPPSLDGSSSRITPEIPLHEQQYVDPQPVIEQYQEPSIQPYHDQVQEPYPIENYSGDQGFGYQDDGPAPVYSTGTWYRRGEWYFGSEVLFMTRTDPRDTIPIVDPDLSNNTTFDALSVEGLVTHNFHPGTRLTLGRFLGRDVAGRDHMLEFEFTGLFEWNDARTIDSGANAGNVGVPSNPTGVQSLGIFGFVVPELAPFFNADSIRVDFDADFNQGVLNFKIASRPGRDQLAMQPDGRWVRHGAVSQMRTLFGGLRYASFNETFSMISNSEINGVSDGSRGLYSVLTNNDMFGLHIGGETVEKYDEWSWGLRGSVGGMANFAQRRSTARSTTRDAAGVATVNELSEDLQDEKFAFVADAGIFGTYQLRPNLHFKLGYNLSYFSGLGLAAENLGFNSGFAEFNINGSTLIHGGSVGFETTW
jgi:hypothetical protein